MMNKRNRKGFTLAELLIVVAIIAVLVAVAIPVFTSQLEKSRDAVTESNIRAAYAEAASTYLTDGSESDTAEQVSVTGIVVKGQQENEYFKNTELPFTVDSGLQSALDKADNTGKVDVTFTWSQDGKSVSASKKGSSTTETLETPDENDD